MTGPDEVTDPGAALRETFSESGQPRDRIMCDFCRIPIPGSPVVETMGNEEYTFCTAACRDQLLERDDVGAEYHEFRRIHSGVSALDRSLPEGIPRNAFVLLSGEPGTRKGAVGHELVWRTLARGEPAVIVSFTEPPISTVQRFLDLQWNVLPALEGNALRIVDCFTPRMDHPDRFRRRMDQWNRYLHSVVQPRTELVDDPGDPAEIQNKIENVIGDLGMVDRGVVHVDSLTEFGTLVQPIRAYEFVKDLRANVPKSRFVPIFACATITTDEPGEFPHDLSYAVDGLVDFELDDSIVEDTLIRRIRVRKMTGVLAITEWTPFEYTSDRGMVTFDPQAEIAKRRGGDDPRRTPEDEHS